MYLFILSSNFSIIFFVFFKGNFFLVYLGSKGLLDVILICFMVIVVLCGVFFDIFRFIMGYYYFFCW